MMLMYEMLRDSPVFEELRKEENDPKDRSRVVRSINGTPVRSCLELCNCRLAFLGGAAPSAKSERMTGIVKGAKNAEDDVI